MRVEPPRGLTVVACEGSRVLGTAKMGPNRPGPGSHVSTASFTVAEEHDYIVINDTFVTDARKTEKTKRQTVYAPRQERGTKPLAVISVELDEDEDVE